METRTGGVGGNGGRNQNERGGRGQGVVGRTRGRGGRGAGGGTERERLVCRNWRTDGTCSYGDSCHFAFSHTDPVAGDVNVAPNARMAATTAAAPAVRVKRSRTGVGEQLDEIEMRELKKFRFERALFEQEDQDLNKKLDRNELASLFRKVDQFNGSTLSEDAINDFVTETLAGGDTIDFAAFRLTLAKNPQQFGPYHAWYVLFSKYQDADKTINKAGLTKMLLAYHKSQPVAAFRENPSDDTPQSVNMKKVEDFAAKIIREFEDTNESIDRLRFADFSKISRSPQYQNEFGFLAAKDTGFMEAAHNLQTFYKADDPMDVYKADDPMDDESPSINAIEATFRRLDSNNDGYLNAEECVILVRDCHHVQCGHHVTALDETQHVMELMTKYSNSVQGCITQKEFLDFAMDPIDYLGVRKLLLIQQVFDRFAHDCMPGHSQYKRITTDKFQDMVAEAYYKKLYQTDVSKKTEADQALAFKIASELWQKTIPDEDGDGSISFSEFTLWISEKSPHESGRIIFGLLTH